MHVCVFIPLHGPATFLLDGVPYRVEPTAGICGGTVLRATTATGKRLIASISELSVSELSVSRWSGCVRVRDQFFSSRWF